MTTIKQVAALAGVSPTTASYALNNRPEIKPETRERVLEAARQLNYIPNKLAQSFRNKRSMILNVITNEDIERNNTFTAELFGILAGAREKHYEVLITIAGADDCKDELWLANILGNRFCDGYLILGNSLDMLIEKIIDTKQKGVLLSSHSALPIAQVNADGYGAIKALTELAYSTGRTRLCYVGYALNTEEERLRQRAFIDTQREHGVDAPLCLCCGYSCEEISRLVAMCERGEADTVLCWNDTLALSVLTNLQNAGISVPGQVAVAGVDDIPVAEQHGLTTARQMLFEKGHRAVMTLVHEIENDCIVSDKIALPCQIIRRGTL